VLAIVASGVWVSASVHLDVIVPQPDHQATETMSRNACTGKDECAGDGAAMAPAWYIAS
jgi:hypothetical protein